MNECLEFMRNGKFCSGAVTFLDQSTKLVADIERHITIASGLATKNEALRAEVARLRAAYRSLVINVQEMDSDNRGGDFALCTLARLDLDACMSSIAKHGPRAGVFNDWKPEADALRDAAGGE